MTTSTRNALGRRGENAAAAYLVAEGYTVIARNWRLPPHGGELDIVACDGVWLVFVEVRARRSGADGAGPIAGSPEESVTPAKRARLAHLAEAYLYANPWNGPMRIDVIALEFDANDAVSRLNHLQDAVGGLP
jgi:putative endonuclease